MEERNDNPVLEYIKNKQYKNAENICLAVLEKYPNNIEILGLLNLVYYKSKNYKKLVETSLQIYTLTKNLSVIKKFVDFLYKHKKWNELLTLLVNIVEREPSLENYIQLTNYLAEIAFSYLNQGLETIHELYYVKQGYEKFPFNKEILINYAIICIVQKQYEQGIDACSKALKIDPKCPRALYVFGTLMGAAYLDEEKAIKFYKKALLYAEEKDKEEIYLKLGISYNQIGKNKLAQKYFKLSESNLAIARNYLKQRKFKLGYKYSVKYKNLVDLKLSANKEWDGKPHKNKTLLIIDNDCYGDFIMYCRYLPYTLKLFDKVTIYSNKKQYYGEILDVNFKDIEVTDNKKAIKYDYYVCLSHLLYYLKMDFNHIPNSNGYLDFPKKEIKSKKLKIGLCWKAGHDIVGSSTQRNINIKEFANLLNQDYEFYSFQVSNQTEDLDNVCKAYNINNIAKEFQTFSDTAKYLQAMDVVVTVDTAVAHLAGALGVKTFMLLPYYPEWRWFDNTEKTEWYASIRIFKQSEKLSWQNEITRVIEALHELQ